MKLKRDKPADFPPSSLSMTHHAVLGDNPSIKRLAEVFSERKISTVRLITVTVCLAWTWYWVTGPQAILDIEAVYTFPWAAGFFLASLLWWVLIKTGAIRANTWPDVFGVVLNFLIAAGMMRTGFLLFMTLGAALPFLCLAAGVRFNKTTFRISILTSVLIIWFTAPPGYWFSRPAYALFAFAQAVLLPYAIAYLYNALRRTAAEAVQAKNEQSHLISSISHELRTPLAPIQSGIDLFDTRNLSTSQKDALDVIRVSAHSLLQRVDQLLVVADIRRKRFSLNERPFAFPEILHSVESLCRQRAAEKGLWLTVAGEDGLDDLVLRGDNMRIEQVLVNLVSNAIKYTQAGSVSLKVGVAQTAKEGTVALQAVISDTGIGIPDSERHRIFETFHQVSAGDTREFGGMGLGLSIVKQISDHMGASIQSRDNPEGGTIFTWRFTLPQSDTSPVLASQSPREMIERYRQSHAPLRCLLIDDSVSARNAFKQILLATGHSVMEVDNGTEGLHAIKSTDADIVFLDLHMPGTSGWDVLSSLDGSHPPLCLPPITVLSADNDSRAVHIAKSSRVAKGYLSKPVQVTDLLQLLDQLMEKKTGDADSSSPYDEMLTPGNEEAAEHFLIDCLEDIKDAERALKAHLPDDLIVEARDDIHALLNACRLLGDQETESATLALRETLEETSLRLQDLHHALDITKSRLASKRQYQPSESVADAQHITDLPQNI